MLAVFDVIDELVSGIGYRGCRYTAADLTIADPQHAAHAESRAYKGRLHALLEAELAKLNHPDPPRGARQLLLLIDGTLVTAARDQQTHPARIARSLAECVLDERVSD